MLMRQTGKLVAGHWQEGVLVVHGKARTRCGRIGGFQDIQARGSCLIRGRNTVLSSRGILQATAWASMRLSDLFYLLMVLPLTINVNADAPSQ